MIESALLEALFTTLRLPGLRGVALDRYLRASNPHWTRRGDRQRVCLIDEPRFRFIKAELTKRGIDVVVVGRGLFDQRFRRRLRRYLDTGQRTFSEYALDAYLRYPDDRRRYLHDCRRIASALKSHVGTSTIILPKYNDDYTLEVVQAFHDTGWTTIVYDREGTITPKRLDYVPPIVARQASTCDYVVAYNETHREFFERIAGGSSVAKPRIVVMGNPASDEWFHRKGGAVSPPGGSRKILFFAFGEFSYVFDTEYLKGKAEVWRSLLADIHGALAGHLDEHPGEQLLYKRGPKGNRDYWAGSEALLSRRNAVLMASTANANQLIVESDVVIAFQTTALIDAMHTDKPIIYCAWGPVYDALRQELMPFDDYARQGAIAHAKSPEELRALLGSPGSIPVDLAARKRIRELYTTNPDGGVARRFADWMTETVLSRETAHVQR